MFWIKLAQSKDEQLSQSFLGLSDKSIANAVNGDYVLWVCRVGFELVPQTRNVSVDGPCVERSVFAPNVVEELFTGDSFARVSNQE